MSIDKRRVRVYGAGGAGINITSEYCDYIVDNQSAEIIPSFIDTSHSNMQAKFNQDDLFILENVDGSGKIRNENYEDIKNVIKQVLLQIKPLDFNIVVFSASGGSGSVIGPLILSELLERQLPSVCLVVGSNESAITAQNTLNTLKSLDSIAKKTGLPVVMHYEHNDRERKKTDINQAFKLTITTLGILCSGNNLALDTKDIRNWVQFNRTTSVTPQLTLLDVFNSESLACERIKDPISIASIYEHVDMTPIGLTPEYHTEGYLKEKNEVASEIHYIISIEDLPNITRAISEVIDHFTIQKTSRIKQGSLVTDKDDVTDSGLIL